MLTLTGQLRQLNANDVKKDIEFLCALLSLTENINNLNS